MEDTAIRLVFVFADDYLTHPSGTSLIWKRKLNLLQTQTMRASARYVENRTPVSCEKLQAD